MVGTERMEERCGWDCDSGGNVGNGHVDKICVDNGLNVESSVFPNVHVIQCLCNSCLRKGIGEYNFDYNL